MRQALEKLHEKHRFALTLIVVGSAWLLWYFRLFPDIDWIIAAGLVFGGIAVLFLDGITKKAIVSGPFLIASGIA